MGVGELEPGQLLPPMRELAVELGVNPNTVAAAYRTLRERGVIETAGRRGSRVRSKPATTGREHIRVDVPEGVRDVANGNPDPALLPSLAQAFAAAAEQGDRQPVLYGEAPVEPELARLARAALDADGVPDGPAGRRVRLAGRHRARPRGPSQAGGHRRGGGPGVGQPARPGAGARAAHGARWASTTRGRFPTTCGGALEAGARALIVTDRAQNPTGAAVTATRARALRVRAPGAPGDTARSRTTTATASSTCPCTPSPASPGTGPSCARSPRPTAPTCASRVLDRRRRHRRPGGGRQRLGPGWVSRITQRAVVRLWADGALDTRTVAAAYRQPPGPADRRARGTRGRRPTAAAA